MADATVKVVVHKRKTMNALDRIMSAAVDLTPPAVQECTEQTQRDARRLLALKSHPPGTPTPSRPGEPPAKISGALLGSVETTHPREIAPLYWSAQVGPTNPPPYGRIQELGGATGRGHRTHLPARPYMTKAVRELMAVAFYEGVYRTWWGEVIRHH